MAARRRYNRKAHRQRFKQGKLTYRGTGLNRGSGHRAGFDWGGEKEIDPKSRVTKYSKNSPSFDEGVWTYKENMRGRPTNYWWQASEDDDDMPFKSERQRRFMYAKHPEIARRWQKETRRKKRKAEQLSEDAAWWQFAGVASAGGANDRRSIARAERRENFIKGKLKEYKESDEFVAPEESKIIGFIKRALGGSSQRSKRKAARKGTGVTRQSLMADFSRPENSDEYNQPPPSRKYPMSKDAAWWATQFSDEWEGYEEPNWRGEPEIDPMHFRGESAEFDRPDVPYSVHARWAGMKAPNAHMRDEDIDALTHHQKMEAISERLERGGNVHPQLVQELLDKAAHIANNYMYPAGPTLGGGQRSSYSPEEGYDAMPDDEDQRMHTAYRLAAERMLNAWHKRQGTQMSEDAAALVAAYRAERDPKRRRSLAKQASVQFAIDPVVAHHLMLLLGSAGTATAGGLAAMAAHYGASKMAGLGKKPSSRPGAAANPSPRPSIADMPKNKPRGGRRPLMGRGAMPALNQGYGGAVGMSETADEYQGRLVAQNPSMYQPIQFGEKPPNLRMRETQGHSCASCKHFKPSGGKEVDDQGRCALYDYVVKARMECDAWTPTKEQQDYRGPGIMLDRKGGDPQHGGSSQMSEPMQFIASNRDAGGYSFQRPARYSGQGSSQHKPSQGHSAENEQEPERGYALKSGMGGRWMKNLGIPWGLLGKFFKETKENTEESKKKRQGGGGGGGGGGGYSWEKPRGLGRAMRQQPYSGVRQPTAGIHAMSEDDYFAGYEEHLLNTMPERYQ